MCDAGVVAWCGDGEATEEDGAAVGLEEGEKVAVFGERGNVRYCFFESGFIAWFGLKG